MACTCGPKEACSQCPPTVNALHEQQRRVVNALQKRVEREAHGMRSGAHPHSQPRIPDPKHHNA